MNVGTNIRRLRKEKGLTLDDVASRINTDTGNLSRLERGLQSYTDDGLRKIARVLGVRVSALFDEPGAPITKSLGGKVIDTGSAACVFVPILDVEASMGAGKLQPQAETVIGGLQLSETWVRRNLNVSSPPNLAVISAYGDSMAPTFNDGDVLFVDRNVDSLSLDAVYVISLNNELFIKRVQRRMDGTVVIKSDNPLYDPHVIQNGERDALQVLGRVVWAWNGRKL